MSRTLAARVQHGALSLLSPVRLATRVPFGRVIRSSSDHEMLLDAVQRLRGGIYATDGALQKSALTHDGRDMSALDEKSWHLLVHDSTGQLCGCMRYTVHEPPFRLGNVHLLERRWQDDFAWGADVRGALEGLLHRSVRDGIGFSEVGGWAVSPEARHRWVALAMLSATYAFHRLLGHSLGVCTATLRHDSAALLLRVGANPLAYAGRPTPRYHDQRFGCTMQLLELDSRVRHPKFEPYVHAVEVAFQSIRVLATDAASPALQPSCESQQSSSV